MISVLETHNREADLILLSEIRSHDNPRPVREAQINVLRRISGSFRKEDDSMSDLPNTSTPNISLFTRPVVLVRERMVIS